VGEPTLLPCPFCGGTPDQLAFGVVLCPGCGCRQDGVDVWNRRWTNPVSVPAPADPQDPRAVTDSLGRSYEYKVEITSPHRVTASKVLPDLEWVSRYLQSVLLGMPARLRGSTVRVLRCPSLLWSVLREETGNQDRGSGTGSPKISGCGGNRDALSAPHGAGEDS
jgi:hypothetical protein